MSTPAAQALQHLKEGNRRFVEGAARPAGFSATQRAAHVADQRPTAVVVGCSDARVPVEVVFDVGVGELFVVRTAGHVLAAASLASVRFAVEKLDTRLVVVLGHEDCGAVKAALADDAPAWLAPILDKIDVSHVDPDRAPSDADNPVLAAAVDDHVRDTVQSLREFVDDFGDVGAEVVVLGGAYKLQSGEVHWLD